MPPRNGQNDSNLATLERRVEELGPSIIRAIEDHHRGERPTPEARPRQEPVASARTTITTQLLSLPREQQGGEWRVLQAKRKKGRKKKATRNAAESQVNTAPPTKGAHPGRRLPDKLTRVVAIYLKYRFVGLDNSSGLIVKQISAGVPQGSVVGSLLWNLVYNSLLVRFDNYVNGRVVAFADDLAIMVGLKKKESVEVIKLRSSDSKG